MELIEVFGSDLTVVNAARVSFAKESTEVFGSEIPSLVAYLAKHNHISHFFIPKFVYESRCQFLWRANGFVIKLGLRVMKVSRRYVDSAPECWIPTPDQIRERDPKLKQGSKETPVVDSELVHNMIKTHTEVNVMVYEDLLSKGVAPEIARCVLPQSMYTEFIETGSLAAYARLYKLRTDPTAQREIQEYAKKLGELLEPRFPVSWKALTSSASE